MTLTEILVASVLSALMLVGIVRLESARLQQTDHIRDDAAVKYPSRQEAVQATLHISQRLDRADRFCIRVGAGPCLGAGGVGDVLQVRRPVMTVNVGTGCTPPATTPDPACFDVAGNYRWDQYSLGPSPRQQSLRFYTNTQGGCGNLTPLVREDLSALSFTIDPAAAHIVHVVITWLHPPDAGQQSGDVMTFPGHAATRGRSIDIVTGLADPNAGVSPPPGVCP
jgi:hypothetical protein